MSALAVSVTLCLGFAFIVMSIPTRQTEHTTIEIYYHLYTYDYNSQRRAEYISAISIRYHYSLSELSCSYKGLGGGVGGAWARDNSNYSLYTRTLNKYMCKLIGAGI